MDEVLDILTEFAPIETLISIIAGLMMVAGLIVTVGGYFLNLNLFDELGIAVGVVLIIAGVLLYVFSSVAGEALELVLG
ncbi:hypothetical protein GKQ38_01550 [Candidatus Nanohaloarchaea archaeon]|nr:hypothetical protein GKQ38_01550 [Candidatus Nanohaloarchaea archaeon]